MLPEERCYSGLPERLATALYYSALPEGFAAALCSLFTTFPHQAKGRADIKL